MKYLNIKVLILCSILLSSCGKSKNEKIETIIDKLKIISSYLEMHHTNFDLLNSYNLSVEDKIKLENLKVELSLKKMKKYAIEVYSSNFSDTEIDDLYKFVTSTAFKKMSGKNSATQIIHSNYNILNAEVESLLNKYFSKIYKKSKKYNPIKIERKDGIYETLNYTKYKEKKDIKWKKWASLKFCEVKKLSKSQQGNNFEIVMELTSKGKKDFYELTKKNIDKPLAIVISKKIISMPVVVAEIKGGKLAINGDFSEKEVDAIITNLKKHIK